MNRKPWSNLSFDIVKPVFLSFIKEEYYIQCSLKTQGGSIPIQRSLPLMESQYNQFHRNRHYPHNTQPAATTERNISNQTVPIPESDILSSFTKPLPVLFLLHKISIFDHRILVNFLNINMKQVICCHGKSVNTVQNHQSTDQSFSTWVPWVSPVHKQHIYLIPVCW